MKSDHQDIYCVIPNFNGAKYLGESIDSILNQSQPCRIVVVDNGSTDGSLKVLKGYGDRLDVIYHTKNLGFAGGVNAGIRFGLKRGAGFIALFNNDAIAEVDWLKNLRLVLDDNKIGIATGKMLKRGSSPAQIDTTGDLFSIWCLAFSRGREEIDNGQYDEPDYIFGATGGASLYRREVFESVGLFDTDFFAYYEDVDLSFRAQLRGFYVYYQPSAVVWHSIGATSSKIPGFVCYHSTKNTIWVPLKNLPFWLLIRYSPRFWLAFSILMVNQIKQGNFVPVIKGLSMALLLTPKKLVQRFIIQTKRRVDSQYIKNILHPDLPPDRHKLRTLRAKLKFWVAR